MSLASAILVTGLLIVIAIALAIAWPAHWSLRPPPSDSSPD